MGTRAGTPLKVLIPGGSGLIGTALSKCLLEAGHDVWILSRTPEKANPPRGAEVVGWDGRTSKGWEKLVNEMDVIVNLAGYSLEKWPWTKKRKQQILNSRLNAGRAVVEAVREAEHRPVLVVQSSGINYYGTGGGVKTEVSPPGNDFLARVCVQWEDSTKPVESLGVKRAIIRTALVFSRDGGSMTPVKITYRFFLSGPLGSGKQYWSWIHIDDEARAIQHICENTLDGPYNLAAPQPAQMRTIGKALAKAMHRPYWFPAPAFGLKLLLGEMSVLVLGSMQVLPERLLESGFVHKYPEVAEATATLV